MKQRGKDESGHDGRDIASYLRCRKPALLKWQQGAHIWREKLRRLGSFL